MFCEFTNDCLEIRRIDRGIINGSSDCKSVENYFRFCDNDGIGCPKKIEKIRLKNKLSGLEGEK